MSYEIEYTGDDYVVYDTGYGEVGGDLIVEVEPVFTDERFDAHNGAGVLQTYGDAHALTGVELVNATLWLIGNNGVELGEVEFTDLDELKKHFGITEDDLLEKLINMGVGQ